MFVTNSSKFNELCTTQYFLYTATKCVCFIRKICAISSINVMWHNDGDFSAHLPLHDGTVIICQYVMVFLFVHRCSDGNVPRGTRRRKPSRDKVALRGKGPPQRVRTGQEKTSGRASSARGWKVSEGRGVTRGGWASKRAGEVSDCGRRGSLCDGESSACEGAALRRLLDGQKLR